MQRKVLLTCKIYLFCIYFSQKKFAIPSKFTKLFRKRFANTRKTFAQKKTKLAWVLASEF